MAQIIVKTPVTSNGSNPVLDSRGQIIFKETLLDERARKIIEKQNQKRPQHLKWIVSDYSEKPKATEKVATPVEEPASETTSTETKPKTTRRGSNASN